MKRTLLLFEIFSCVFIDRGDLLKSNTILGIIDIQIRVRDASAAIKILTKMDLKKYLVNCSGPGLVHFLGEIAHVSLVR